MEDDSIKIRKEVVKRIDMMEKNWPFVIKKIHDVDPSVRVEVYKRL